MDITRAWDSPASLRINTHTHFTPCLPQNLRTAVNRMKSYDSRLPELGLSGESEEDGPTRNFLRHKSTVLSISPGSLTALLQTVLTDGHVIDCADQSLLLLLHLQRELSTIKKEASALSHKPRVYFEEWGNPLVSGIRWIDELIELAGGHCVFPPDKKEHYTIQERVIQPEAVVSAQPDVIIASWGGISADAEMICQRPNWQSIPAVRNGHVYSFGIPGMSHPGPLTITNLARKFHDIFWRVTANSPFLYEV